MEGLARASPLGLWAGVRAAGAVGGWPWLVLAHVVGVDLIVNGAEHGAGLVTCRAQPWWELVRQHAPNALSGLGTTPVISIKPQTTRGTCRHHLQFTGEETEAQSLSYE